MSPSVGIEPGPYWWEASALTTGPSLLPLTCVFIYVSLKNVRLEGRIKGNRTLLLWRNNAVQKDKTELFFHKSQMAERQHLK